MDSRSQTGDSVKISEAPDGAYRIDLPSIKRPLFVHPEKRMIGPVATLCDYLNISRNQLEGNRGQKDPRRLDSFEIFPPGVHRARLVSIDGLNQRIDGLAACGSMTSANRRKYHRLINQMFKLLNINDDTPSSKSETDELTELKREVADMRRLLNRLLELHPEALEEEQVEMIDDSTVTEYTITLNVEEDRMTIDCIPADEYDGTDADTIRYYGNIDQLNDLKTKLVLKGDITSIDGDAVIADDYTYLKATLIHKLRKISKINRKADMDNASTVSVNNFE